MKKYDLVVCGGGTSGVAAGYIAAKNGLKTLIIEKNIHLGGTITSALVMPAMKSNTKDINCEFLHDFISELKAIGGQITYGDGNSGWFNPELSKIALDSLMEKAGCDVLFDTEIVNAISNKNHVNTVCVSSKTLSLYIDSLYFVDTTGDGNFSAILKNKILENNSQRQPMTLRFHVSGIDLKKFSDWLMEFDKDRNVSTSYVIDNNIHLSTACTWDKDRDWALTPIFRQGIEDGVITEEDASYFQLFTVPGMGGTVSLNCPRLLLDVAIDPLDPLQTSKVFANGRKQIYRLYSFMHKYFSGFENSYISNIADMPGIRESRRVQGKKIYTKDDILSGKTYENPVLHSDYPIDIHSYKKDDSTLEKMSVEYELPIECLMSSDFDNLFIAGRNVSADFSAQAALRVQTSCFSMGEAVAKHVAKLIKSN